MTNFNDALDAIAIETNSTDDLERVLARSLDPAYGDRLSHDDILDLIEKTIPLGRYGAQCRNLIRHYYSHLFPYPMLRVTGAHRGHPLA